MSHSETSKVRDDAAGGVAASQGGASQRDVDQSLEHGHHPTLPLPLPSVTLCAEVIVTLASCGALTIRTFSVRTGTNVCLV